MRAIDLGVSEILEPDQDSRSWQKVSNGQHSHEKPIPFLCFAAHHLCLCLPALNVAITRDAASSFCAFAHTVSIFRGHLHWEAFWISPAPSLLLLSAMFLPFCYNYLLPDCLPGWTLNSFKPVMGSFIPLPPQAQGSGTQQRTTNGAGTALALKSH